MDAPSDAGPLFLASASPRRAALLKSVGLEFVRFPVELDETPGPGEPRQVVVDLARRKAEAARERLGDGFVLAADTLVFLDGVPLGKPETTVKAMEMLRALSGRSHEVWTGVAVARLPDGEVRVGAERTVVTFHEIPEEAIRAYVETGEPLDKAGGYAIQGEGGALVANLEGPASNVVGLPMVVALRLLAEAGYPLPPDVRALGV